MKHFLRIVALGVFTYLAYTALTWLLNQPSDFTLILAAVDMIAYVIILFETKFFKINPLKVK